MEGTLAGDTDTLANNTDDSTAASPIVYDCNAPVVNE